MGSRNGSETPPADDRRGSPAKGEGNLSAETVAMLQRRTEGFQRATSGKGQPLTYGTGAPPKDPPKRSSRRAKRPTK